MQLDVILLLIKRATPPPRFNSGRSIYWYPSQSAITCFAATLHMAVVWQ